MPVKYTKEILQPLVESSKSWAEVCRKLGIKPATGSQSNLTKRAKILKIASNHFTGKLWNKGRTFPPKQKIEVYLVKNSSAKSHDLKLRLIREGVKKAECEICKITHWMGELVVLELDHKNSDHFDNRIENIQIICPNCHAIETRKRKKARVS
jgi:hypothetical protein